MRHRHGRRRRSLMGRFYHGAMLGGLFLPLLVSQTKPTKYCRFCGKTVNQHANFCKHCGRELG